MNRSLQDIGGGLLLVPQFTLAADTRKGMRPSLTPAADPGAGERVRLSRRARTGAPSDRRSRPLRGLYAGQAHQWPEITMFLLESRNLQSKPYETRDA